MFLTRDAKDMFRIAPLNWHFWFHCYDFTFPRPNFHTMFNHHNTQANMEYDYYSFYCSWHMCHCLPELKARSYRHILPFYLGRFQKAYAYTFC